MTFVLIDGALVGGTLIQDLPDLGAITEDSSFVAYNAGAGRFTGAAIKDFIVTELFDNAATIASLTVNGSTTLEGTLNVTGAATFGSVSASTLNASGAAALAGTLGVSGLSTLTGVNASGNVAITGTLGAGNTTVNGTLHATGVVIADAAMSVGTTFTVGGNTTLTGDVAIDGASGLTVAHDQRVNGVEVIAGGAGVAALTLTAGGINIIGNLGNSGALSGWYVTNSGSGPTTFGGGLLTSILSAANIVAPGYFANSDLRVKTEVNTIDPQDGELFVTLMRPTTYLKKGRREAGFIAQEMVRNGYGRYVGVIRNEDIPEYVDDDGVTFPAGEELNLNISDFVAYHHACLQSFQERIAKLERMLNV